MVVSELENRLGYDHVHRHLLLRCPPRELDAGVRDGPRGVCRRSGKRKAVWACADVGGVPVRPTHARGKRDLGAHQ
jgi:hypothetical protein